MDVLQRPVANLKLEGIRGLLLDSDGVLTGSELYFDVLGQQLWRFHARDGAGLAMLCRSGIKVGVISGRPIDAVARRHRELGLDFFRGSCRDKAAGVDAACAHWQISPDRCAFVGDDWVDLAAFSRVRIKIAVADAAPEVRHAADGITQAAGGRGAVREVCEALLAQNGGLSRWLFGQDAPSGQGGAQ